MLATDDGKAAVLTVWNSDGWIVLFEISHADITTQRFALAMEDVSSGGNTYTALSLEIELATNSRGLPGGALRVSNIPRTLWNQLKSIGDGDPPQLTIKLVRESAPDTIEAQQADLDISTVAGTGEAIEAEYGHEDRSEEPYPAQRLIPPFANWISYVG